MVQIFNSQPLLELQQLEAMTGKKIIAQLVLLYEQSSQEQVRDGIKLIWDAEFEAAGRMFHSLKSSSGNLGLHAMQEKCREIEEICLHGKGDKATLSTKIQVLPETLAESLHCLKAFLNEDIVA